MANETKEVQKWKRWRFKSKDWQPKKGMESDKHPYWISGQSAGWGPTEYVIIAWLPAEEKLNKHWHCFRHYQAEFTEHDAIEFNDRFPKPENLEK